MLSLCECCEALTKAPRRVDVPRHLRRLAVSGTAPKPGARRFACETCGAGWTWSVSHGWHAKWPEDVVLEGVFSVTRSAAAGVTGIATLRLPSRDFSAAWAPVQIARALLVDPNAPTTLPNPPAVPEVRRT